MELAILGYVAVFIFLAWTTMEWHVERDSPPSRMVHDLLVSAVWPAHVVVLIYRAEHRRG
jgi:hypothetical protein